jgi:hypothetical protein
LRAYETHVLPARYRIVTACWFNLRAIELSPGVLFMAAEISSVPARDTQQPHLLNRLFLDHPRSLDESYGEHLRHAFAFGTTLIGAGIACLIHALVPALFVRTGSTTILRLHERMRVKRRFET